MQNCYWQMNDLYTLHIQDRNPPTYTSSSSYKVFPNSDTIINSVTYVKFYSPSYWGAIRQDILEKKVYLVTRGQASETLLYNFNYTVGDSVKTKLGDFTAFSGSVSRYRVIDSVFYQSFSDGICRKTFRLKYLQLNSGYYGGVANSYITEGIGNDVGINANIRVAASTSNPGHEYETHMYTSFLAINNQTIMITSPNTCVGVGIKKQYYENFVNIYPNPSNTQITIDIPNYLEHNFLTKIYDILGNAVLISEEKNIKVKCLPTGCYYIKCFDHLTGQSYSTKFVKD
jgi:hypothetical protein